MGQEADTAGRKPGWRINPVDLHRFQRISADLDALDADHPLCVMLEVVKWEVDVFGYLAAADGGLQSLERRASHERAKLDVASERHDEAVTLLKSIERLLLKTEAAK